MGPVTSLPATEQTNDVAAADLNGDGRPDLVAISEGLSETNHVIDLYLNAGGGTFSHSTTLGGTGPTRFVVADLNGDGRLDLALANNDYLDQGNTVGVLPGNGDGTFGAETLPGRTGVRYRHWRPEWRRELDLAGPPTGTEVASPDAAQEHRYCLRDATRLHHPRPPSTGPTRRRGGRFTVMDGSPVAGAGAHPKLALLRNTATGASAVSRPVTSALNLLTEDIDGDGDVDVVEAAWRPAEHRRAAYLRGNGDGTLAAPIFMNQGFLPTDVAAADFTGDGRLDLAVANEPPTRLDRSAPERPLCGRTRSPGAGRPDPARYRQRRPRRRWPHGHGARYDDARSADRVDHAQHGWRTYCARSGAPHRHDAHAKSVIAADLNGDGHPDLAWTPRSSHCRATPLPTP
jgi:hypothetical protein